MSTLKFAANSTGSTQTWSTFTRLPSAKNTSKLAFFVTGNPQRETSDLETKLCVAPESSKHFTAYFWSLELSMVPCSSRSDELRTVAFFLTPRDAKECTAASDARGEYEPSLQVSSMSRPSNWFVEKHLGLSGAYFSFLKRSSKVEQEEEDMQVLAAAQEQHKV